MGLTIGQLARETGLKIETIRYYEKRNLIPSPYRRDSGYREFSREYVERIRCIKHAKKMGFTLKEIGDSRELLFKKQNKREFITLVKKKMKENEFRINKIKKANKTILEVANKCVDKKTCSYKQQRSFSKLYSDETITIEKLKRAECYHLQLYENYPVALWEEDLSELKKYLDKLKDKGVKNFRKYFEKYPDELNNCAKNIFVLDLNKVVLGLYQDKNKEELLVCRDKTYNEKSFEVLKEILITLAMGVNSFGAELEVKTLTDEYRYIYISICLAQTVGGGVDFSRTIVAASDITDIKKAKEEQESIVLETKTLKTFGNQISSKLPLDKMLKSALKGISSITSPDLALIFIKKEGNLYLQDFSSSNHKYCHETTPVHHVGECLCGLAAVERTPMYSIDINKDPRCTWEECKMAGLRSFAAFPIIRGKKVLGVLGLGFGVKRDFAKQSTYLKAVVGNISIALQNSLLYEKVKKQTDKMMLTNTKLRKEIVKRLHTEEQIKEALYNGPHNLNR